MGLYQIAIDNLDAVGWLAREGKDSKAVPNLVMGQKERVVEVLEMREMVYFDLEADGSCFCY